MSDDRSGRHEPDETRAFSPLTGSESPAAPSGQQNDPDGGPRSGGSGADSWMSDGTQQVPRTPTDDATGRMSADRTAMMPRDEGPAVGRAEAAARAAAGPAAPDWDARSEPVWAGRAEVRQARPGAGGDVTGTDWAPVDQEPRRVWWSPILIGLVVLLLVAALGAGTWLIVQSAKDDDPAAPPATTPAVSPAVRRPTTTATSAAATTRPPTTAPAQPANVQVPALRGLSSSDARQALDRVGLTYRLRFLPAGVAPGTVVDSDPAEGREVPADTEVTLFVASARSTAPTAGTSAASQAADVPDE